MSSEFRSCKKLKFCFAGNNGINGSQQPVQVEMKILVGPSFELGFHGIPCFRPVCTDFCEGKVTLGEFGSTAIYLIEDVHHNIQSFILSSNFFNV